MNSHSNRRTHTRIHHSRSAHKIANKRNAIISMGTFLICLLCAKVHPREDNIRTKLIRRRFKQNTKHKRKKNEMQWHFWERCTRNIQSKRTWYLFDLCVQYAILPQFQTTPKRRDAIEEKVAEKGRESNTQVKKKIIRAIEMLWTRSAIRENHSNAKHIKSLFDVALNMRYGYTICTYESCILVCIKLHIVWKKSYNWRQHGSDAKDHLICAAPEARR